MELHIRTARMPDAQVLAEYNSGLAFETEMRRLEPERILAGVRALLSDPSKGTYYVAETQQGGKPVVAGQLLITYEWSDWRNGSFWWIQSVYVVPSARRQGVFRQLYAHLLERARANPEV